MSVFTIGDVLKKAGDFEEQLEEFYADLRDRTTNDGVRLLTHYLARHKRHLPDVLKTAPELVVDRMFKVPLSVEIGDEQIRTLFNSHSLASDATADQLLDTAIEFVNYLIGFYKTIAEELPGEDANVLFTSLVRLEETDLVELKKIKAMNYF